MLKYEIRQYLPRSPLLRITRQCTTLTLALGTGTGAGAGAGAGARAGTMLRIVALPYSTLPCTAIHSAVLCVVLRPWQTDIMRHFNMKLESDVAASRTERASTLKSRKLTILFFRTQPRAAPRRATATNPKVDLNFYFPFRPTSRPTSVNTRTRTYTGELVSDKCVKS